ncbi:hypothetical protein EB155_00045 [archaeon]|jgi:hypothetical protein|nr:hypothetical protein [Asgard group archaeon]NDB78238.1 hypothetical protein [archaeon]NDF27862.1 hypothetical protein [archaeon]|tara:strand:+ start:213 stop:533 length:321 start_codon:yes stop_codon:yes gene_type:complete
MMNLDEDLVIQEMMNKILLIALEDGEITKDELAILEQVKLDVQNLRMGSTNIDEESLKSEIGVDRLMDFRKILLENAYEISQKDDIITEKERNLINSIIKSVIHRD